jgi:hypothetical protein
MTGTILTKLFLFEKHTARNISSSYMFGNVLTVIDQWRSTRSGHILVKTRLEGVIFNKRSITLQKQKPGKRSVFKAFD